MATLWRIIPIQQQKETRRRPPEQDGWRLSRGTESSQWVRERGRGLPPRGLHHSTLIHVHRWVTVEVKSRTVCCGELSEVHKLFLLFNYFYFFLVLWPKKKKKRTTSRCWVLPGSLLVQLEENLLCDEPLWWHLKKNKNNLRPRDN